MRPGLESRGGGRDVAHEVRFLGRREEAEIAAPYQACDVVCVPSRNEPFGIVILEAWNARQGGAIGLPAAILLLGVGALSWVVSLGTLEAGSPSLWLVLGTPLLSVVGLFWVRWWTTRARTWTELEGRPV